MSLEDGRIKVALVFGGRSSEHAVSCSTAASVMDALDPARYDVGPVGISRGGRWVLMPDDRERLRLSEQNTPEVTPHLPALAVPLDTALTSAAAQHPNVLGDIDVVLPLLHGPFGEDGTIQGMLDLLEVPYVGCGVFTSAAMQDKEYMRMLFAACDFPVGEYEVITDKDWTRDQNAALNRAHRFDLPVFVKPARAGSSVGITRVKNWDKLREAIEAAREHDPKVIVEASVHGREVECAVLEGQGTDAPRTSVLGEVVVANHDFYDFDAKYIDPEGAELLIPADIPPKVAHEMRHMAARAFEAVGCEGLARVDFYYTDEGTILLNEINTMPGFTPTSMFPRLWEHSGVTYAELLDELLQLALNRRIGLR